MAGLIHGATTALLSLALDAATMRQQAIAQNIANANTPGYQPVGVRFDDHFADARQTLQQGRSVDMASLSGMRPVISVEPGTAGSAISLDMEVAKLSENALHHQVLLKALNRHLSIMSTAVNEGKR